ncbi:MAG: hypothetical protein EXR21_02395 [Flavobacteriaceae bacterium]|nr:hypothetical protein [Flavobacteriaceae bacterium]
MKESELLSACVTLTSTEFELYTEGQLTYEAFHYLLSQKIFKMMNDGNPQRLLQALYRIDVNELKYKEAISRFMGKDLSDHIATLVIEREMQKVKTRAEYRK